MRLAEVDGVLVVLPDGESPGAGFTRDVLDYLRVHEVPFLIGGMDERVILTFTPVERHQRDALISWWHVRTLVDSPVPARESPNPCACRRQHSALVPCRVV